jgi:hypothetical protein
MEFISPELAQIVGGLGAGALAYVANKLRPHVRMLVRLALDNHRRLRRLEAHMDEGSADGQPRRPRTPTPAADELERAAEQLLGSADK